MEAETSSSKKMEAEKRKMQKELRDCRSEAKASNSKLTAQIAEEKRKRSSAEKDLKSEHRECKKELQRLEKTYNVLKKRERLGAAECKHESETCAAKLQAVRAENLDLLDVYSAAAEEGSSRFEATQADVEILTKENSRLQEELAICEASRNTSESICSNTREPYGSSKAKFPSEIDEWGFPSLSLLISVTVVVVVFFKGRRIYLHMKWLEGELSSKQLQLSVAQSQISTAEGELAAAQTQLASTEYELRAELGEMMKVDGQKGALGTDFSCKIFDENMDKETMRFIKIQCPGVCHSDVKVSIIFNGCDVRLNRQASRGVEPMDWERRFQFRPSDGLFEFVEDQASLDKGYLQLVFRSYAYQKREFRFPEHFSLTETDCDRAWSFEQDADGPADAAGGPLRAVENSLRQTAPGRLEITGEEMQRLEEDPAAGKAETSASPIDTEEIEATNKDIEEAAVAAAGIAKQPEDELHIASDASDESWHISPAADEKADDEQAIMQCCSQSAGSSSPLGFTKA
jgi:hypothetical protein